MRYGNAIYVRAGGDSNPIIEKFRKRKGKADRHRNIRRIRNQKVT